MSCSHRFGVNMKRKTLINKLDKLSRAAVIARDGNTCQWCGKTVEGSNRHVSHVIPRSKGYALRWDLKNLKVLCFNCHLQRWHKHPLDAWEWFKSEYPKRAKYLSKHKNDIILSKDREKFMLDRVEELK